MYLLALLSLVEKGRQRWSMNGRYYLVCRRLPDWNIL
jgi:hypothetical protein